jgi:hypothetical protein
MGLHGPLQGYLYLTLTSSRTMALGLTQPLTEMSTRRERGERAIGTHWAMVRISILVLREVINNPIWHSNVAEHSKN